MSIKNPVDWELLNRLLEMEDFSKKSCFEAVSTIFEKTTMIYRGQWLESEAQCDKLTDTVVKKNIEIDRLNGKIAELSKEEELLDVGIKVSEEVEEETR